MGNAQLKQHYETASKTGVLKISNQKLKDLPPEVKQLCGVIRNLDLSENRFQTLPDSIAEFKVLKHFNISHNRLESLPQCINQLNKLEIFNASFNHLFKLPPSIAELSHLKQVNLSNNFIAEFPEGFCGMKHLDVLDLSHNKITAIPEFIEKLLVSELNLNQNQVSSISENLANCPKLKVLRLEENCLPLSQIHVSLLQDSKVHTLCLDGNLFDSKQLMSQEGYDDYMARFTAVKKKMF